MRIDRVAAAVFLLSVLLAFGCSFDRISPQIPQKTGSGFLKKDFLEFKSVAILPFEGDSKGEVSDTFALCFLEKFPQVAVVERKEVQRAFKEQDFTAGRLEDATRMKIGKAFGVQAVITGSVYYPSILRWLLQVKVIDVETGSWVGHSSVEIDFAGALGLKEGCKLAVESLKVR